MDPAKNSRLVEAELTPELEEYVAGIEEVTNYVNKTLSLFKIARNAGTPACCHEKNASVVSPLLTE